MDDKIMGNHEKPPPGERLKLKLQHFHQHYIEKCFIRKKEAPIENAVASPRISEDDYGVSTLSLKHKLA